MSGLNYSKWDHIEISDDEDDTHPNIDTPSLFRWRHQARVERMEEKRKKKESFKKEKLGHEDQKAEIQKQLKEADSMSADFNSLQLKMCELEKQEKEFRKKEEELSQEERLIPWNIDTICQEGKSKTIINKSPPPPAELTDEERAEKQQEFSKKHRADVRKFGMMQRYNDSQQFLQEHDHLVCEETANYLVIWCIDLQVEEKHKLMKHVSYQTIVMQFILELAKSLKQDPRSCVRAFFSRIKLGEKQYMDAFNDELKSFRERIKARAQARIDEAMKEYEEEERKKRLGPGGVDPQEVMESLPDNMKKCFESRDIEMLQNAVMELPKEEAEYHIKRCIDSGLWVPNASDTQNEQESGTSPDHPVASQSDEIYDKAD